MFDVLGNDAPFMAAGKCVPPPDATADEVRQRADNNWFPPNEETALATRPNPCAGCPVIVDCAAWAIPQPELEGIWGGLSTAGRAALRTGRPAVRAQCGTSAGVSAHRRAGEKKCAPCQQVANREKREWNARKGVA